LNHPLEVPCTVTVVQFVADALQVADVQVQVAVMVQIGQHRVLRAHRALHTHHSVFEAAGTVAKKELVDLWSVIVRTPVHDEQIIVSVFIHVSDCRMPGGATSMLVGIFDARDGQGRALGRFCETLSSATHEQNIRAAFAGIANSSNVQVHICVIVAIEVPMRNMHAGALRRISAHENGAQICHGCKDSQIFWPTISEKLKLVCRLKCILYVCIVSYGTTGPSGRPQAGLVIAHTVCHIEIEVAIVVVVKH
jgi:hypothetical protein